jgi:hypothetical protein
LYSLKASLFLLARLHFFEAGSLVSAVLLLTSVIGGAARGLLAPLDSALSGGLAGVDDAAGRKDSS